MNACIREIAHQITNDTAQRAAAITAKLLNAVPGALSRATSRPHVASFLGFGS